MYKRINLFLLATLTFLTIGCGQKEPTVDQERIVLDTYDQYGEAFSTIGAVPVQAVIAESDVYLGKSVTIEGTVREVCQRMGCWLTLESENEPQIRVRVARDEEGEYEFTVPKDISGRRIIVSGTLTETELSTEMMEHFEAEGETDEGDDHHSEGEDHDHEEHMGSENELSLTAVGVFVEKVNT